jgi:hypothetical protein
MQLVRSTTFSWLGFSSCITGISCIIMNELKCRAPSLSASHTSRKNTAQIGLGREQTTEFQNYGQVMFRPLIRTDKKYVNGEYTILVTFCVRFFHAFFVTDRFVIAGLPSIGESRVYSSFSVQLRHKTFVIIRN